MDADRRLTAAKPPTLRPRHPAGLPPAACCDALAALAARGCGVPRLPCVLLCFFDVARRHRRTRKWERARHLHRRLVLAGKRSRASASRTAARRRSSGRRSLLGDNPDPDWIDDDCRRDRYAVTFGERRQPGRDRADAGRRRASAARPIRCRHRASGAALPADAPPSMSAEDGRVTVDYGFAGLAEIRTTQVYVRNRFLGWPNFFFDTKSPFFGM